VILPTTRFHKKHAVNLADFQQQVLHNYFSGVHTTIICGAYAAENLQRVFQENYPVWEAS
jgi:hypothetical protein